MDHEKFQAGYQQLITHWKEASILGSIQAVLDWDEQTQLPNQAADYRAQQSSTLASLAHRKRTDPVIGSLLDQLSQHQLPSESDEAVDLRQIRRLYDRAVKLPESLVAELAETGSKAHHAWVEARQQDHFASFAPWLHKMIALKQQQAECLRQANEPRYDALLDEYEPGAKSSDISRLFAQLRQQLVPVVEQVVGAKRKPDVGILHRHFPQAAQETFGKRVIAQLGFDFEAGRVDRSAHPFCTTLGPRDVRLTTRFNEQAFESAFFGMMHEAGHGMYEQGLPAEHFGTPRGEAVSLSVHESQSRLWENTVGRSLGFWKYWFPHAQQQFPAALAEVSLDAFHFAINNVTPSLIRVEADELTYDLHIIVRFELEQALITGDCPVDELPSAWRERYQQYLGLTPPTDAKGCLQDVHWSAGLFGYFPTYALGNMFGAQLIESAKSSIAGYEEMIEAGDYRPLLAWLREQVHQHGQRFDSTTLLTRITGKPPSIDAVMNDRRRIARLYGV